MKQDITEAQNVGRNLEQTVYTILSELKLSDECTGEVLKSILYMITSRLRNGGTTSSEVHDIISFAFEENNQISAPKSLPEAFKFIKVAAEFLKMDIMIFDNKGSGNFDGLMIAKPEVFKTKKVNNLGWKKPNFNVVKGGLN